MFGSRYFWDKSPSWFLKILKLLSFYSGNFKIFKNTLVPNYPLKHVITSTYVIINANLRLKEQTKIQVCVIFTIEINH